MIWKSNCGHFQRPAWQKHSSHLVPYKGLTFCNQLASYTTLTLTENVLGQALSFCSVFIKNAAQWGPGWELELLDVNPVQISITPISLRSSIMKRGVVAAQALTQPCVAATQGAQTPISTSVTSTITSSLQSLYLAGAD